MLPALIFDLERLVDDGVFERTSQHADTDRTRVAAASAAPSIATPPPITAVAALGRAMPSEKPPAFAQVAIAAITSPAAALALTAGDPVLAVEIEIGQSSHILHPDLDIGRGAPVCAYDTGLTGKAVAAVEA